MKIEKRSYSTLALIQSVAMKGLLISPYDAYSHRYWWEGLQAQFPEIDFTVVTLPPRHFSWRFRGNSLTLAHDVRLQEAFDFIVATSMTDLSALKGMLPSLANVPTALYFHENQFVYPSQNKDTHLVDKQITSIYSAVSADLMLFNSAYNRKSFLEGADRLLAKMPDGVPVGVIDRLKEKSSVLPVALGDECFRESSAQGKFSIIWNHRWEHDKGMLDLQRLVVKLLASPLDFVMHVIGQQFRQDHPVMLETTSLLREHDKLGQFGFVEARENYLQLLGQSHCVLSTSLHDFQGLSIQEGMASGCIPVVPDSLAYPEYVPSQWRYADQDSAVRLLGVAEAAPAPGIAELPRWGILRERWQDVVKELTA